MTLVQLETFYWIVRLGSFSATARHLRTSQPAISARISQLEAVLGTQLFDREQRMPRLTARGQVLFEDAEVMVDHLLRMRHRISDPALVSGTIRVGAAELVAVEWLPQFVAMINEAYPEVRLELQVDLTLTLQKRMASGLLDMVILPGPVIDSSLVWLPVGTVAFDWMASPDLGLGDRLYSPSELARHPIITLTSESNLHRVLEEWFASDGAELARLDVCNSLTVLTEMVMARIGVGYLASTQTAKARREGRLELIATTPRLPALQYYAVYPRRSILPLAPQIAKLAADASSFDPPPVPGHQG